MLTPTNITAQANVPHLTEQLIILPYSGVSTKSKAYTLSDYDNYKRQSKDEHHLFEILKDLDSTKVFEASHEGDIARLLEAMMVCHQAFPKKILEATDNLYSYESVYKDEECLVRYAQIVGFQF